MNMQVILSSNASRHMNALMCHLVRAQFTPVTMTIILAKHDAKIFLTNLC